MRIIVGEKEIDQAGGPHPDQNADRHSCIARGFDQQRTARDDGGNAADDRVTAKRKRQKQRVRAE